MIKIIATLAVILFSFSLAFAGGDSGTSGASSTTTTVPSGGGGGGGGGGGVPIPPTTGPRLSQIFMEKLLSEAVSISVNLVGPGNYWTDASINNDGMAAISIDSGLVKPGRYAIYVILFGRDNYSTLQGSGEAPLFGKNTVINIQLLPPRELYMKIYIPEYHPNEIVEWRQDESNGNSSWGPRDVKQDDHGYYIESWVNGTSTVTLTVGNSKFHLEAESLFADYVNNGYAMANNEEVFSNAEIRVSINQGFIYPHDFPEMTLDEAIESVPTHSVVTLAPGSYVSFIAKNGITVQGAMGNLAPRIDCNSGPIEVVKNPETDEPLVLKNLVIGVYNPPSALHKQDNVAVTLDHVVISSMFGASAISGEPTNLKMNHCTLISDQGSSTALNITWPQGEWNWQETEIKNSVIVGFKQVINLPLGIPAYNNLLWNNQDEENTGWWIRTKRQDPMFLNVYPPYIPDISSSPVVAAADDGSYIGAVVPFKSSLYP